MEIFDRIENYPWSDFRDAYGQCDAPRMVSLFKSLGSSDVKTCDAAIFEFWSSICHQGDIYCVTPHALPFLIEIGLSNATLLRTDFLELIADMATCAAATQAKVQRKWERRTSSSPGSFQLSASELAQLDFDDVMHLRSAFVENSDSVLELVKKFRTASPEFSMQLERKIDKFNRQAINE